MAAKAKHGPRQISWGPPATQAMDGKERKDEQEAPTLPRAPVYISNMTVNRWSQHVPDRWRDFALDQEETRGLLRGESDREYDLLELEASHHATTLPLPMLALPAHSCSWFADSLCAAWLWPTGGLGAMGATGHGATDGGAAARTARKSLSHLAGAALLAAVLCAARCVRVRSIMRVLTMAATCKRCPFDARFRKAHVADSDCAGLRSDGDLGCGVRARHGRF
jgi:hypothetical protein